jgi:DNA-binding transcriptional regulator LsrR (DeoR family)
MKNNNIDMGEYRDIAPIEVNGLTISGFQFNCDNNCIFFCINGSMYENEGAKRIFGASLEELFPEQHRIVVSKMEQHEKDIAKLMWKKN